MKILIIEDEHSLLEALTEILKKKNYIVDAVYNGIDGFEYAMYNEYDVILLDIMLPKLNGLDMLKKLRNSNNFTPVLLLSAKSDIQDKVTGLNLGADDYITKPFSTEELLARINSVSRRKNKTINTKTLGNLIINQDTLTFSTITDEIKVSLKEYQILELLFINKNQIISKEQFIYKIWGYDFTGEYNSVEVYISFVRKKLKAINSNVKIKVHRGLGYSLEVSK